jgi:predicted amidohydrolase
MYRPVRLLSLGFRGVPEERIWDILRKEGSCKPDLIILPEAWLGDDYPVEKCDEVVQRAAEIAALLKAWLVCPLYRLAGPGEYRNSAFLLDRQGKLVHVYDKIFPYWTEFSATPPCKGGQDTRVTETDFGRVAVTICFDVNFPAVWQKMDRDGAELVVWPSDYSAGRALQAHAVTHHYYIAGATRYPDARVYDISGDEISYCTGDGVAVNKTTIDLDRTIFHENFNLDKCERLLAKYPDIRIEKKFPQEQWFILASRNGETSVREAAREFEMEDIRTYIRRSGLTINPSCLE